MQDTKRPRNMQILEDQHSHNSQEQIYIFHIISSISHVYPYLYYKQDQNSLLFGFLEFYLNQKSNLAVILLFIARLASIKNQTDLFHPNWDLHSLLRVQKVRFLSLNSQQQQLGKDRIKENQPFQSWNLIYKGCTMQSYFKSEKLGQACVLDEMESPKILANYNTREFSYDLAIVSNSTQFNCDKEVANLAEDIVGPQFGLDVGYTSRLVELRVIYISQYEQNC